MAKLKVLTLGAGSGSIWVTASDCADQLSPGKHRSGCFCILLLYFLSEVQGLADEDRLKDAMEAYAPIIPHSIKDNTMSAGRNS